MKKNNKLKSEENRSGKLIERLPVVIFESDLDNNLTYISPSIFELLGYRPNELIGKNTMEFFHPGDRAHLLDNIRRKLEGIRFEDTKYRIRKKNGEYITTSFHTAPILKQGKSIGMMGVAIDISETEKLKKELADSEVRYRSLFTHAPLGIYRSTPDGRIIIANAALIKMTGYSSLEELKKINLEKPGLPTGFERTLFKKKLEEEGEVTGLESVWTRKDGTLIWVRESAILIKDSEGKQRYYDGVVEDITFYKNAESLLRRQRNLLNIAQQMAHMGSWEEDLLSGTILWSREEYRIFELPEGTTVSEALFFSYVHPDDRHLLQKKAKLLNCKTEGIEAEYRLVVNGKEKWIHSIMTSHCDKNGKVIRLYGMDMDITKEKKQQLRLEKESQLLKKTQELGHIGSWELNVKTKEVKASEVLIELYGLPKKEKYTLADFTQRIHPEDIKHRGMAKGDWSVLKRGAYHSTYRLLVNGEVIWINAAGEVIFDNQGNPETVIAAVQDITWQKKKESELKRLEQEKAAIILAIPDMIFVFDREGVYRDFIPGIDISPLIPPEKFLGKKILDVLPQDIAARHFKSLQKAFETGQVQVSEYTLTGVDGSLKYFEARFSPVNHDRAVVIVRDVTQREKTRKSLQKSNKNLKLYSQALEESPISIIITDKDCTIEYVNKKFTESTGYQAEEVIGKNSRILKSGIQDWNFYHHMGNTIGAGKIWRSEIINRKKDDNLFWESTSISPIYNAKKEITHFIQVSQDITERKKSEESLQKLAAIVDSSDAIIISKTPEGIISSWNRGAERVYGYKAEEVLGLPINIIVPPELKKELEEITKRIKEGERIESFETRRICKSSTMVDVSLSLSGIKNDKGELTGIAMVGQDITRQKQLESELIAAKETAENATRTKSLFLANMSHEIRTPLNAILGFSEILSKRLKDPVQKEYIESMHSSGKALLNLINDLLILSKAEAGKLEFYRQSTDVRYLAHDIESIFRLKARQKNLEFRVQIAENVPRNLFLDELKIRQVLLNLTSNAIKFTEKGFVEIRIKAEQISGESADLIMEVKDTGKGIPPQFHKKIFKVFEQENTAISKNYGGTGLGLAITQQIVSQMQGHINIESEEGKGSLFSVYLPDIALSDKKPGKKETKSVTHQADIHFKPATILVVDDTPNNRKVLKAALEDYPFRVLEAANGQEALKLMKQNKIDLIFMDIRMPVMDGIEAAERIRKQQKWHHIPIVALTASSTEFQEKKFTQKGFNNYLRKPATLMEIESVLIQHLQHDISDISNKESVTLSAGTIQHFPEIVQRMQKEILPLQQKLTGIRPRNEVKKLAEKLIALGQHFQADEIFRYGEKLHIANHNFLLEKEKHLIDNLPNFVNQLKKSYNEHTNQ